jgi:hypothetical protein
MKFHVFMLPTIGEPDELTKASPPTSRYWKT